MGRRPKTNSNSLTTLEYEIISALWTLEKGSVKDVQASLDADPPLAYTSVSTVLRILEKKGYVISEKEGRGHLYIPQIEKEAFEATHLNTLIENHFNDTPSHLVKTLLNARQLTTEELAQLRLLIDQQLEKS